METTKAICTIDGCGNPLKAKGLCRKHYLRLRRNGTTNLQSAMPKEKAKCAVVDCDRPARGRGFCTLHYRRAKLYGDPIHLQDQKEHLAERFSAKVKVAEPSGCWEWQGWKDAKGYGKFWNENAMQSAHRVSYRLHRGEIPSGMYVLHRCDNPGCVNPEHLFLGTHQDNMADMRQKSRRAKSPRLLRGEKNPSSRLTAGAVADIKQRLANGQSCTRIAKDVGCDRTTISLIKLGKTWRHA